jgi:hypothetical protein
MKILVFTDTHTHEKSLHVIKKYVDNVDFIICLGDITWFGQGANQMLDIIDDFGKDVLMMHGNHEYDEKEFAEICKPYKNVHFSHKEVLHMNGYAFATFGGGGFARQDPDFEEFSKIVHNQVQAQEKLIVLLHQPPYGTTLDEPFPEYHSGNMSIREFIEKRQPYLVLAGHIHECFGAKDKINKTTLLNPGIFGSIIDLDTLSIEILGEDYYRRI